ncbi:MAG: transcription-repair coupling factor [Candidatus Zixiibacteriota bacterium]
MTKLIKTIADKLQKKFDESKDRSFTHLYGFSKSLLINEILKEKTIIIAPELVAYALFYNLKKLGIEPIFFPSNYVMPYENKPPESQFAAFRIKSLFEFKNSPERPLIATPEAIYFPLITPETLNRYSKTIEIGQQLESKSIKEFLISSGFWREDLVELLGSFALRGDILDIFSSKYPDPVRIEMGWDEVEKIKLFAAENQTSYTELEKCEILPPSEFFQTEKNKGDLEYDVMAEGLYLLWCNKLEQNVSSNDTCGLAKHYAKHSIILEPDEVHAQLVELFEKAKKNFMQLPKSHSFAKPAEIFPDPDTIMDDLYKICIAKESNEASVFFTEDTHSFYYSSVLRSNVNEGEVTAVTKSPSGLDKLKNLRDNYPLINHIGDSFWGGFLFDSDETGKIGFLTDRELVGRNVPQPRVHIYRESNAFMFSAGLEIGDYVAHQDHGIGRFLGLKSIEFKGRPSDCLELEYADNQKLLVPIEDFHLVQKFHGVEGTVKLNKLGGGVWTRQKKRAAKQIRILAGELLHLYALRKSVDGFAHPKAKEYLDILKGTFPFEPTEDQARAISEVYEDLSSEHPSDRLICGDVGFGKTEVAIRAAVRVAAGGKQVAVLVPTTVLAQQHCNNFKQRLKELPLRVESLSRFVKTAKQKETVDKISKGLVDIVIGTHRLLSKDIVFKELGLLIVDEEQRFGVAQKEKIKQYRANVDVITLTATPIPRTLSFSMGGLRDLSLIATAPEHRLPIFTRLINFDDDIIREAIEKEIERGGQVFFLHNRVQTIKSMYNYLSQLVPHFKIAISHGQMKSRDLSKVITKFRDGKYQILLTTTVIESGTDIPNVNTIFINRADRFGISDLYQLRGRVGRSETQAYAYLITPPYKNLGSKARKRLKAILSHTQLGSGFSLSMRDLEIRGAGEILGKKQSGVVSKIGMEMYSKLLSKTVSEMKNQGQTLFIPPAIDMDFHIGILTEYIHSVAIRIELYQRFFTATDEKSLKRLFAEIRDRFGPIPDELLELEEYLRARILAARMPISSISVKGTAISIVFKDNNAPQLFDLTKGIIDPKLIAGFDFMPNLVLRIKRGEGNLDDLKIVNRVLRQLRDYYKAKENKDDQV